jgi:hypothetical protein
MEDALFAGALAICQMMLRGIAAVSAGVLPPEVIRQKVDEITAMPTYVDVDREKLVAELEHRFTVFTAQHQVLGSNDDHLAWLPMKMSTIQWRYFDRYRLYLEDRMSPSAIESIETITLDVLSRLEDTERPGFWDRRGLVSGNVQSGKTASYCGLIARAADVGYKVIIVLAGMHNSLRSQTQMRLDEGFLGFMSEPRTGSGQQTFKATGVGLIDGSIRANTGTNRTEQGDFSSPVANQFGIHPGGLPLVFVVKKNVKVLGNLLAWLRACADGVDQQTDRRFVRHVPVLVIDDEADLASVDTKAQAFDEDGKPDPDHNPTRINELLRRVLMSFEKVAYVGYTATPFANIFIHDKGATPDLGDDVFPRSFIVNLPAPSNYMGPSRVFGISADEDAGLEETPSLPLVRPVEDHADSDTPDEQSGWMPPKLVNKTEHVPLFNGKRRVPPSLRQAILAFILATTVRKIRGIAPAHNSMLVHVVRYTKVQALVGQQVEAELKEIRQRLQNGDGDREPGIVDEFQSLWIADFVPTNVECTSVAAEVASPPLPAWTEVAQRLRDITAGIQVKLINGSAKDALDYEEHKATGMNVIAVGGDKLSRGLTLEGLTVSYFLRASRMYDTLMQMGRWFGYRDGYLDVCRLYTTGELIDWFAHIAAAGEELQQEFQHMVNVGGTPKDYGLKVRSHPLLLVTSSVKMRHGTELKIAFSGNISETIIFSRSSNWLARNFVATENWLISLGAPPTGSKKGGYTWPNIGVDQVLQFLASYTSHEDARRADTSLLRRYISAQSANEELVNWTVHLASSGVTATRPDRIAGLSVGMIQRSPFPKPQRDDRYGIRRLVSPTDELVDLDKAQRGKALSDTIASWENAKEPKKKDSPTTASGPALRAIRSKSNGLLILYPLDPVTADIKNQDKAIIGMAMSFPKSDTAREISYIVDNTFVRRGGDDEGL